MSRTLVEAWCESAEIVGAPPGEFSKPEPYLQYYERELFHFRDSPITIVEIGVFRGQFLETLARCLPRARIIGIDFQPERVRTSNSRIVVCLGDQADDAALANIINVHAPDGVDIIIDDASHIGALTAQTFLATLPLLKSGGTYYVEDWGTGYWRDWEDGADWTPARTEGLTQAGFPARVISHDAGMIGAVKSMLDHVGAVADPRLRVAEMTVRPGIVKLVKA